MIQSLKQSKTLTLSLMQPKMSKCNRKTRSLDQPKQQWSRAASKQRKSNCGHGSAVSIYHQWHHGSDVSAR